MTMMINATPSGHGGRTSYERGSAIVALSSSSFTNDKLATLPFLQDTHEPRQLTLQTAKEIVSSADIIEQALKESGRSYDRNLPMVWAMGNHTTSREISARIQAEKRGYIYDGFQKGIDREISQQQHQESISTMKEEAGWMSQLVAARDRCFGSISTAIVRGIILVAFIKLLPFLYGVLKEGASFTAVAGEILGTICPCTDNGIGDSTSSAYTWVAYSWSYAGSYILPVVPQGWGFSFCQIFRGVQILASASFLLGVGFLARFVNCPAAGSFITSVIMAYYLSMLLVIPDLIRLVVIQTAMSGLAVMCLVATYLSARRSLRKTGTPSSALVNEVLMSIDDINFGVEVSPFLLVIVTIIGVSVSA